jgi:hypothetical protein
MKRIGSFVVVVGLLATACSDDPTGVAQPNIRFSITAPTQVATKTVIDVEARITEVTRVQVPLVVIFEKANVNEPFFEVGRFILTGDQRLAVARVPVLMDPRIRITVRESGPAELSVSQTVQVDVLDFP